MMHFSRKSHAVGIATLATLGLAIVLPSHAQTLSGFGSFAAPNGQSTLSGSTLNITNGTGGAAGSIWSANKVSVGSWTASFKYQDTTVGGGGADGFTLAFQNQGTAALGSYGGALGYATDSGNGGASITGNSAAVEFSIYGGNTVGYGINSENAKSEWTLPAVSLLSSGDLINVSLSYSGSVLSEILTDTTTSQTYSSVYATNLSSLLTGQAYVGFTGSSGGVTASQQISSFSFSSSAATNVAPTAIAFTGLNADVVVNSPGDTAQPFDIPNQYAFYGTADSAVGALPTGTTLTSSGSSNGGKFNIASGTSNNALLISENPTISNTTTGASYNFSSTGTLTVTTPAKYSAIGILSCAANGSGTATVTFHYTTGAATTGTLGIADWFNGNSNVGIGLGRTGVGTNTQTPSGNGPHLNEDYLSVDPTRSLSSITFTDVTTGEGASTVLGIFSVNGVAAAPEPGETAAMLLGGLGLLGMIIRKRRLNA
jgi:MYXO-CTERM domain-containing protein